MDTAPNLVALEARLRRWKQKFEAEKGHPPAKNDIVACNMLPIVRKIASARRGWTAEPREKTDTGTSDDIEQSGGKQDDQAEPSPSSSPEDGSAGLGLRQLLRPSRESSLQPMVPAHSRVDTSPPAERAFSRPQFGSPEALGVLRVRRRRKAPLRRAKGIHRPSSSPTTAAPATPSSGSGRVLLHEADVDGDYGALGVLQTPVQRFDPSSQADVGAGGGFLAPNQRFRGTLRDWSADRKGANGSATAMLDDGDDDEEGEDGGGERDDENDQDGEVSPLPSTVPPAGTNRSMPAQPTVPARQKEGNFVRLDLRSKRWQRKVNPGLQRARHMRRPPRGQGTAMAAAVNGEASRGDPLGQSGSEDEGGVGATADGSRRRRSRRDRPPPSGVDPLTACLDAVEEDGGNEEETKDGATAVDQEGVADAPAGVDGVEQPSGAPRITVPLDAADAAALGAVLGHSSIGTLKAKPQGTSSSRAVTSSAPLCPGHRMPAKLRKVKKSGPNKGRWFYCCPAAREEQCSFFQWKEEFVGGAAAEYKRAASALEGADASTVGNEKRRWRRWLSERKWESWGVAELRAEIRRRDALRDSQPKQKTKNPVRSRRSRGGRKQKRSDDEGDEIPRKDNTMNGKNDHEATVTVAQRRRRKRRGESPPAKRARVAVVSSEDESDFSSSDDDDDKSASEGESSSGSSSSDSSSSESSSLPETSDETPVRFQARTPISGLRKAALVQMLTRDDEIVRSRPLPSPPVSHGGREDDWAPEEGQDGIIDTTQPTAVDRWLGTVLRSEFGFTAFRPGQLWALKRCLNGESSLLVAATGSGKSLVYQMAALLLRRGCGALQPFSPNRTGLTLCVSPLVALMRDQVRQLPGCLSGVALTGRQSARDTAATLACLRAGACDLLFVSPERVVAPSFRRLMRAAHATDPIALVCVDEAHCLSEWGHGFRPAYLRLRRAVQDLFGDVPILALTATATPSTTERVQRALCIPPHGGVHREPCARPCLFVSASTESGDKRFQALRQLLARPGSSPLAPKSDKKPAAKTRDDNDDDEEDKKDEEKDDNNSSQLSSSSSSPCWVRSTSPSVIVYTGTQREAEVVAEHLRGADVEARAFHAGLGDSQRARIERGFLRGDIRVVVATTAFGLGFNKPDVRGVIHWGIPRSPEDFLQQIGRAGRDGLPAWCHTFVGDAEGQRDHRQASATSVRPAMVSLLLGSVANAARELLVEEQLEKAHQQQGPNNDDNDEEEGGNTWREVSIPVALCEAACQTQADMLETLLVYTEEACSWLALAPSRFATCDVSLRRLLPSDARRRVPVISAALQPWSIAALQAIESAERATETPWSSYSATGDGEKSDTGGSGMRGNGHSSSVPARPPVWRDNQSRWVVRLDLDTVRSRTGWSLRELQANLFRLQDDGVAQLHWSQWSWGVAVNTARIPVARDIVSTARAVATRAESYRQARVGRLEWVWQSIAQGASGRSWHEALAGAAILPDDTEPEPPRPAEEATTSDNDWEDEHGRRAANWRESLMKYCRGDVSVRPLWAGGPEIASTLVPSLSSLSSQGRIPVVWLGDDANTAPEGYAAPGKGDMAAFRRDAVQVLARLRAESATPTSPAVRVVDTLRTPRRQQQQRRGGNSGGGGEGPSQSEGRLVRGMAAWVTATGPAGGSLLGALVGLHVSPEAVVRVLMGIPWVDLDARDWVGSGLWGGWKHLVWDAAVHAVREIMGGHAENDGDERKQ